MAVGAETAPVECTHLQVGSARIFCALSGAQTRPPLVLLHGIAGSSEEWRPALPLLGQHLRVYAPDAPGHGRSDKPPPGAAAYDVPYFSSFIGQLLDTLRLERPVLGALSGGGVPALRFALEQPRQVAGLVLVDAAGLGPEVAWPHRAATLPLTRFFLRRMTASSVRRFSRLLCHNPEMVPPGWIDAKLEAGRDPASIDAFMAVVRAGLSWRGQKVLLLDRLSELQVPTLIVWGREDRVLPVAHAYAAKARLPAARLVVLERCGHVPPWDCPAGFSHTVVDFAREALAAAD